MTRYRADPPACRVAVTMEGMAVLYHRPSGITHVLLPPSPEILDVLAGGPGDADGIAAALVARFGVEADEPVADIVAARLDELAAAGLVFRA